MKMTGDQRIAASRQRVWEALNDPAILKQCIPGCQSLEQESAERMKATIALKVGPISARFAGAVTLSDLDPPNSYTISGEGQGGTAGFARGGAKVRLAEDAGATLLAYDVDAQVGGRLAQLGGPVIDATAKQLAGTFFKRFGEIVVSETETAAATTVEASLEAQGPAAEQPTVAPPSTATPPLVTSPPKQSPPMVWILAVVVAALVGFLIGHVRGGITYWAGLSIGLLVLIAAVAGFELGRRLATPVVMLDAELLARLNIRGDKQ
jgi:carbon monoxide dehydrogenase subunit G